MINMISNISPEIRCRLIWSYSIGFLCSFPFIFVAWALHSTVLYILPTIFSIGFFLMVVVLMIFRKQANDDKIKR